MLHPQIANLFYLHKAARTEEVKDYRMWKAVNDNYSNLASLVGQSSHLDIQHIVYDVAHTLARTLSITPGKEYYLLDTCKYISSTQEHWVLVCVAYLSTTLREDNQTREESALYNLALSIRRRIEDVKHKNVQGNKQLKQDTQNGKA